MTLNNEEIVQLLERLDKESRAVREEALRMCWYMRGSISYSDAIMLSQQDKDIISEIIKKNLETAKETGMPFF